MIEQKARPDKVETRTDCPNLQHRRHITTYCFPLLEAWRRFQPFLKSGAWPEVVLGFSEYRCICEKGIILVSIERRVKQMEPYLCPEALLKLRTCEECTHICISEAIFLICYRLC